MTSLLDNPDFIAACKPRTIAIPAPKKRKSRPEAKIQDDIIQYLKSLGYLVSRVNSAILPSAHGTRVPSYIVASKHGKHTAGHPDLVAYRDGRAIFFEVKTPTGKLSERQKRFLEILELYNMPAFVVRNIDDVKTALKSL